MTRLAAALALLVLLVLAAPAGAANLTVTSTADSGAGTLRAAIQTASGNGQPDVITIPAGTYNLTSGELDVTGPDANNISFEGDPNAPTVVHAAGAFRVLCITGTANIDIQDLTISGGQAAQGRSGVTNCTDGQGGGIRILDSSVTISNTVVEGNSASPAGNGGGGGIYTEATGSVLQITDSIIRNNTVTSTGGSQNGGGGIYSKLLQDDLDVSRSTISGNTATVGGTDSGGGGIYTAGGPLLTDVTVSGNSHRALLGSLGGGGGGLFSLGPGGGTLESTTFFGNHSDVAGGAIGGPAATDLKNSIIDGNTAPAGAGCAQNSANSLGNNIEFPGATCDIGGTDLSGQDPQLGPLAVNGANNGTLTHELLSRESPAVEFGDTNTCPGTDQRGVGRFQFGANCDSGAYEFDGKTRASVPDCSPTGVIPLSLQEPPGGDVDQLKYLVNGGDPNNPIVRNLPDTEQGGAPTTTDLTFAEGRYTLEYWGMWSNGEQRGHGSSNVLVDKTDPTISVQNNQRFNIFVITRRATVDVQAADALSGLVQNPSGDAVRVSTARRGATTFDPAAVDLCQNTTTDPFPYRVLAPGLGVRTVLERVSGKVRIHRPALGSSAQASQKGLPFSLLTQPRELPIRSLIDAKDGTARLTTARSPRESNIQDGLFRGGLFQVLQSHRKRSKGLTTLALKGGSFRRCLQIGKAGRANASISKSTIRRLRANAHGRFRTRGRHSAATVRGTIFSVSDRCDGTLTKVKRGRVVVRDFTLHKTVVVTAGKSYLARARR